MSTLQTSRLLLRPVRIEDAVDLFSYASDPEVTRYLFWDSLLDVNAAVSCILNMQLRVANGESVEWGIELLETGTLIGTVGIYGKALGYSIGKEWWGQGFATEACAAVVQRCQDIGIRELTADTVTPNGASVGVLLKVGFQLVRVLQDHVEIRGAKYDLQQYRWQPKV